MAVGQPGDAATSHEPTKKIARQARYTRRRPAMSDTFPMNVMLIAYDTKYPVTTHPAISSFWISMVSERITSGSTAETMVRSSAPINHGEETNPENKPGYWRARDIQSCGLGVAGG